MYYEQIIRNLLRNADKYSPAGEPVEINVAVQDDGIRVEVVDHGAGITPEVQAIMFERFQRGQTGENAPPGWGLGLYFARKLTEAQGGQLAVRSPAWPVPAAPGAAFAVSFPVAAEAPEEVEDG
ncbi:MAG: sensor histidine kinase [Anaerolineae bacterium]